MQVFSWGYNDYGQLGHGTTERKITPEKITNPVKFRVSPTLVQGDLKGRLVIGISCGRYFSVAVLHNGEVVFSRTSK